MAPRPTCHPAISARAIVLGAAATIDLGGAETRRSRKVLVLGFRSLFVVCVCFCHMVCSRTIIIMFVVVVVVVVISVSIMVFVKT